MNWKKSLVIGAGAGLSLAAANAADATIRVEDGKVYLTEFGKTVQVPATPELLDAIARAGGGTVSLPNDPAMIMSSGGGSSLGFGVAPDPATQRAIEEYLKQHPEQAFVGVMQQFAPGPAVIPAKVSPVIGTRSAADAFGEHGRARCEDVQGGRVGGLHRGMQSLGIKGRRQPVQVVGASVIGCAG